VTLAVDGLSAVSVMKYGAVALTTADIPSLGVAAVFYDGTHFQLLNPALPPPALQAEMEAGTETALRLMSPLRVKEAIDALAPIASTAEAEAGTNNTNFLTPLRLREGFNATGTAPVYACRAWVNFDGTGTVAIRASGNVSSITDNNNGNYTINLTVAMQDVNYAVAATSGLTGGPTASTIFTNDGTNPRTTTAFTLNTRRVDTQAASDSAYVEAAVFR
jgi:hypothetical protein